MSNFFVVQRYPKDLKLALTANDLVEGFKEGKIASLIGTMLRRPPITHTPPRIDADTQTHTHTYI
jgi:hypothetical protein